MGIGPGQFLARVIFWRYQRGSWQYDILCGLILLFIFLTPKSVFDGSYFRQDEIENPRENAIETDSEPSDALSSKGLVGKDEDPGTEQ